MSDNKYYRKALADFVGDVASAGAVRHLADLGYTADEISPKLDFPTPREKIAEIMFGHFVDTGLILMEEPSSSGVIEKISYVKTYDKFGRSSLRRVVEEIPFDGSGYEICEYGKWKYKDPAGFQSFASSLPEPRRSYALTLPWPLRAVWCRKGVII